MPDTSRDLADLHPLLREAWEYLREDYEKKWPEGPVPFITATYRGPQAQHLAFESSRSRHRYGDSMHNYKPSFAFDIHFVRSDGTADWNWLHFERFAREAKKIGLFWGGDWSGLRDGPHFQFRNVTREHARRGEVPHPPVIPQHDGWKLVLMVDGQLVQTVDVEDAGAVVTRSAPGRKRYYVDVRSVDHA